MPIFLPTRRIGDISVLFILSGLISIGPFAMEAYLPAIPTIAEDLATEITNVNLSISYYMLGLGIGQFFGGPISDQIGRLYNVVFGLSIFFVCTLGALITTQIEVLQVLRFGQALGCGFATIVGMPVVRDLYSPQQTATKMPTLTSVMFIAPIIAPLFGTVLMQYNWRLIFLFLLLYAAVMAILFCVFIGETNTSTRKFSLTTIKNQIIGVLNSRFEDRRLGLYYSTIVSFSSGAFLVFITNAAWAYMDHFGLSEAQFPLFFSVHLVALFTANVFASRLAKLIDVTHTLRYAAAFQCCMGTILLVGVCFYEINIYGFVGLVASIIATGSLVNSSSMAIMMTLFQRTSGSVVSVTSLSRSLLGAALGVLSVIFFNDTLVPLAAIMAISATISTILTLSLPRLTLQELSEKVKSN